MKEPAVIFSVLLLLSACSISKRSNYDSTPNITGVLPPGLIIDQSHAPGTFIGSPSITKENGEILVAHDFFGPSSGNDTTVVFASKDNGQNWEERARIKGQWWSSLFVHDGALYLMGVNREYGDIVIRRSLDHGLHWTTPTDSEHGLLSHDMKAHTAPVPVIVANGRIWRAIEDADGDGGWGYQFRAHVMSAEVNSDLLNARSWTISAPLPGRRAWRNGQFSGWLEGNAVPLPHGGVDVLERVDCRFSRDNVAADIHVNAAGIAFDPSRDFVELPGGCKKFSIRWIAQKGVYAAITNVIEPPAPDHESERIRNTLALVSSKDLVHWHRGATLVHSAKWMEDGFQYADWIVDGNDMLIVARVADGDDRVVKNPHDANKLLFYRLKNYRRDL